MQSQPQQSIMGRTSPGVPATSSDWPEVPPAPGLTRPDVPEVPPAPVLAQPQVPPAAANPPALPPPITPTRPPTRPSPTRAAGSIGTEESPIVSLQRTVRRQQAYARNPRQDLVWQPRFAYTSALVILLALTVVSMPLWIVLYRITDATANGDAPARVADLVALCMMLLGGFIAGAAAWVIIIEMRGRVRMVDTLARTGEREMIAPAAPELPVLDAPLETFMRTEPMAARPDLGWDPAIASPSLAARAEAVQVSAAATLEASSKLLGSFSSVLKSFGQLPAQVAMLAVALALFVGATVLSLNAGAPS